LSACQNGTRKDSAGFGVKAGQLRLVQQYPTFGLAIIPRRWSFGPDWFCTQTTTSFSGGPKERSRAPDHPSRNCPGSARLNAVTRIFSRLLFKSPHSRPWAGLPASFYRLMELEQPARTTSNNAGSSNLKNRKTSQDRTRLHSLDLLIGNNKEKVANQLYSATASFCLRILTSDVSRGKPAGQFHKKTMAVVRKKNLRHNPLNHSSKRQTRPYGGHYVHPP